MKLTRIFHSSIAAATVFLSNTPSIGENAVVPATVKAVSMGALADPTLWEYGFSLFSTNGIVFYKEFGGGSGGRGFSIAVFDPLKGLIEGSPQHFDTWNDATTYSKTPFLAHSNLLSSLNAITPGKVVAVSVADDAGINYWDTNTVISMPVVNDLVEFFGNKLGSEKIKEYSYRNSFAGLYQVGNPVPISEALSATNPAVAVLELPYDIQFKKPALHIKDILYSYNKQLVVESQPNAETTIQASTNLVNWVDWITFTSQDGIYTNATIMPALNALYGRYLEYYRAKTAYP